MQNAELWMDALAYGKVFNIFCKFLLYWHENLLNFRYLKKNEIKFGFRILFMSCVICD